jgi:hypothetical protein
MSKSNYNLSKRYLSAFQKLDTTKHQLVAVAWLYTLVFVDPMNYDEDMQVQTSILHLGCVNKRVYAMSL